MRNCRLLHRVIMERKHYLSKQDIGDMHGHGHALPLFCMVGGEQLGEKQKLSRIARKILLLQHGNNHQS